MTRIRILSIELEGSLAETLPLVRDALLGGPQLTTELVALEAPTPRALPAAPVAEEPAERARPAATARNAGKKMKSAAPKAGPRNPRKVKATAAPEAKAPAGGRTAQATEIRRRIRAGESNAVIAQAIGVSEAGVQYHRKKMVAAGELVSEKRSGRLPEATHYCKRCGQMGADPVRCDNVNCREKR